jgi:hypothetical protein
MLTFSEQQELSGELAATSDLPRADLEALRSNDPEHPLQRLQHAIGNQAMLRLIRSLTDTPDAGSSPAASQSIAQGLSPTSAPPHTSAPVNSPFDERLRELREAALFPQPQPPEPTVPGDTWQQKAAIPEVVPDTLWYDARVVDRMKTLAAETEARERVATKPGGAVAHTAKNMLRYWHRRFVGSVDYILFRRHGDDRAALLKKLRVEEAKLIKSTPADLVEKVDALREKYKDRWQKEVKQAVDGFLVLASNEALYLTASQAARPVNVYGLPDWVEGTVEASSDTTLVEKSSKPIAPAVLKFMKAVQERSHLKAKADNYTDHEAFNPSFGSKDDFGKYSFDVDLGGLIKLNADGFYERDSIINFFLAVNQAAKETRTAWLAIYNDFEVQKTVNERLKVRRIGFAGGAPGPGGEGSIHHGPSPYLLHIHFNIMPIEEAAQFIVGRPVIPPYLDLGE